MRSQASAAAAAAKMVNAGRLRLALLGASCSSPEQPDHAGWQGVDESRVAPRLLRLHAESLQYERSEKGSPAGW